MLLHVVKHMKLLIIIRINLLKLKIVTMFVKGSMVSGNYALLPTPLLTVY